MKPRTTYAQIQKAIQACPDGPVILWHFKDQGTAHVENCNRLVENMHVLHGVLTIRGQAWKVTTKLTGKSGGGFVLLTKLAAQHRVVRRKKDPKTWWAEQQLKRTLTEPK